MISIDDYENEISEVHQGFLAKVILVEEEGHKIYFRPQGKPEQKGDFTAQEPTDLMVGDVICLGNNCFKRVPPSLWDESEAYFVGVVRKLMGTKVLLETNGGLHLVPEGLIQDVKVGNTVKFSFEDGIAAILSESPIRLRDSEISDDDVVGTYCKKHESDGPTFDDFGGYFGVVSQARELIQTQLRETDAMKAIGARPIRGVLLTGPPGTGKTHLARIIAHEAKADLFLVSGPSIVSKWVGDSEETLRRIFQAASERKRAIIFFDEIDSIAERRSSNSHEASKRLVAQLLTLMDGFDRCAKQVMVVAATNRRHDIDEALLRPGRFDWEIKFDLPSQEERLHILQVQRKTHRTVNDLPLEKIASLSAGWSPARLQGLWVEAAGIAVSDQRTRIAAEDMAVAFERIQSRLAVEVADNEAV